MGNNSSIEWTDATWNPVRGCSRISPGCGGPNHQGGCYAETIAARFSGPGQPFEGLAERTPHGGRWTGKMDVAWNMIDQPIRWRRPRRIFANSMSDLFHKDLPRDDVAVIYGTAIAAVHLRGHTFQILTKRADHMRELLSDEEFWEIANAHASSLVLEHTDPLNRRKDDARATCGEYGHDAPPPGIWLGVSVEDQERADERIPDLLATPAAVRFLSGEPLLGVVDLLKWFDPTGACCGGEPEFRCNNCPADADWRYSGQCTAESMNQPRIDWVIAGGESGPRARPMYPDWARSLRDQCAAAGVPFFFKQWGEWGPDWDGAATCAGCDSRKFDAVTKNGECSQCGEVDWLPAKNPLESLARVGKKAAGAELDGRLHREFPA